MKDYLGIKDKKYNSKLITLALPFCFQSLMIASVAASDALMLGSVEQNAMSAVSLATQIQFVQNLILSGVTVAESILGSQYWGKKDRKTMNDIFSLSIRLSSIISLFFFVACLVFPRQLMMLYTNEESLISIGAQYLNVAALSYLLVGIIQPYTIMSKVSGHVKTSVALSCTGVVVNIIFNYILINVLNLGAVGAANATNVARIIELCLNVYVSLKPTYIKLKLSSLFKTNKVITKDFIKCMIPLMLASLLWGLGFTSYTSFMGHLGEDAAAANSVTAVIRDLVCAANDGLANGGGILVGNELGAGNLDKGKLYGYRLVRLSFVIGIASGLIMLVVSPLLVNVINLTDRAKSYFTQMMYVMAVYMIGRCVNTITINGVLSAGGDTVYDTYSLFVSMWCIALPLAALGTYYFHWPVVVIYACTCLDEVGKIPWTVYHFSKNKWVKDLTR